MTEDKIAGIEELAKTKKPPSYRLTDLVDANTLDNIAFTINGEVFKVTDFDNKDAWFTCCSEETGAIIKITLQVFEPEKSTQNFSFEQSMADMKAANARLEKLVADLEKDAS